MNAPRASAFLFPVEAAELRVSPVNVATSPRKGCANPRGARTDGASAWQQFWRVTLPSLRPAHDIVVALSVIESFRVFDILVGDALLQRYIVSGLTAGAVKG